MVAVALGASVAVLATNVGEPAPSLNTNETAGPLSDMCYTTGQARPELQEHATSLNVLRAACTFDVQPPSNASVVATYNRDLFVRYDQRGKTWYTRHVSSDGQEQRSELPPNTAFTSSPVDLSRVQYGVCQRPFARHFGTASGELFVQRLGPFTTTGGGPELADWSSIAWRFVLPADRREIFGWRLGPASAQGEPTLSPPLHVHHFQLYDRSGRKMIQHSSDSQCVEEDGGPDWCAVAARGRFLLRPTTIAPWHAPILRCGRTCWII